MLSESLPLIPGPDDHALVDRLPGGLVPDDFHHGAVDDQLLADDHRLVARGVRLPALVDVPAHRLDHGVPGGDHEARQSSADLQDVHRVLLPDHQQTEAGPRMEADR
ncbi:hypothetical protein GC176_22735 [bacterium]|nr:hypothetical protein [bacterium]